MTSTHPNAAAKDCRVKPRRRTLWIGAGLLSLAVIGLAVPAIAHGPGGPGRDQDNAPHGWMRGPGPHGEGMYREHMREHMGRDGMRGDWGRPSGHHWSGPHGEYGRHGMMFGPGSVERMVDRLARAADASSDQRQKMNGIAQAAAQDMQALRQRHRAGREQLRALLTAPSIDRGKLETLRAEQMKLADEASKRITTAVADIAEVLNPAQREELGRMLERRHGRRL